MAIRRTFAKVDGMLIHGSLRYSAISISEEGSTFWIRRVIFISGGPGSDSF